MSDLFDDCPDDFYLNMERVCPECGETFDPNIGLFKRYGDNSLCNNCDREEFEDSIGYESK